MSEPAGLRRLPTYVVGLPKWGFEARRRVRKGALVKGSSKPEPSGDPIDIEALIWIAVNHPVVYWLVALIPVFFLLFVLLTLAAVVLVSG